MLNIRWLGADYGQFRTILETKLTLDNRKALTPFNKAPREKRTDAIKGTLIVNLLFGCAMASTINHGYPPLISLTFIHTFIMTMTAMALVADFSSLLLDATDNIVLLPRPIDGRTILIARLAHVAVHLALVVGSLSLGTLILGTIRIHPAFAPVFLMTLMFSTMLLMGCVALVYLGAAQRLHIEKLRNAILYVQMGLTIAIIGGYQILPRIVPRDATIAEQQAIVAKWWIYLIPPAWMAAPADMLVGQVHQSQLILSGLGLGMPILSMLLLLFVLAPKFQQTMIKLGMDDQGSAPGLNLSATGGVARWVGRWITRDHTERAVFLWTWMLCSRDRKFKLRTYPILAMLLVVGFSLLFNMTRGESLSAALETVRYTNKHLFLLYFGCPMILSSIMVMRYSDAYEAAWVYHALPVDRPGIILMGALKAVICRVILPIFLSLALIVLAVWGLRVLPDVAVALIVTLTMNLGYALIFARQFPFAERFNIAERSGRFAWNLAIFTVVAIVGVTHFAMIPYPSILAGFSLTLLGALQFFAHRYRQTSWEMFRHEVLTAR